MFEQIGKIAKEILTKEGLEPQTSEVTYQGSPLSSIKPFNCGLLRQSTTCSLSRGGGAS